MRITIFTPTYNRADKLQRVYESLIRQKSYDFEWLIIDDGSTDDTESTVIPYLQEKRFQVRYYRQKNGGKHRAYNLALQLAQGDWFLCVDSDDWLADNAVEQIVTCIGKLTDHQYIVAYKSDETGKQLSDDFPTIGNCTLKELSQHYRCNGEFSLVFPIVLAREFTFPTFKKERFITEAVIYDRIDREKSAILLPEIITICEYQEEGLSNNLNHIMKENPAGYCLYFMQRIDYQDSFFKRFITAGKYQCFCRFAKEQKSLYTGKFLITVALARPLGIVFLLYYKMMRGF